MTSKKERAVIYTREVTMPEGDPEPLLYILDKWVGFDEALGKDAGTLIVAFPEVLGDTLFEMVINLGKLAESGKSLQVTKDSPFFKRTGIIDIPN